MEPRSFDRGKKARSKSATDGGRASMEPRSFDRGKIKFALQPLQPLMLQWSRDRLIAESRHPRRLDAIETRASMEPRSFDRGKHRGLDERVARPARFNGAAIV